MYIEATRSYYGTDGSQHASRANFLLLVQTQGENEIRAAVRKVALSQLGHFMMGRVKLFGKSYTVSGAYGSDGLPLTVDREAWDKCVPLPSDLYEKWSNGGGWNSAGSEAGDIRTWAIHNLERLAPKKC